MDAWSYGFGMVVFFYWMGRWGGSILELLRVPERD